MHIPVAPTFEELKRTVQKNYWKPDLALVKKAYLFAEAAHRGTVRLSGHPEITHPTAVACMLAELRMGLMVVCAGLLHDVIEDTSVTYEAIKDEFGSGIADLVLSVTKLQHARYRGMDRYIENHRRMFLAMANDMRAVIIKFADRLHNLETLAPLPESERVRIAREAIEIHAAIAARLCMGEMKGDIEDLAFKHLDPKSYNETRAIIDNQIAKSEEYINHVIKLTGQYLKENGQFETLSIYGRAKRVYSLYKKLRRYNGEMSRLHDLIAIRIIVRSLEDCYAVLGLLHQHWRPLTGRIKDYISQPKPNGYQSLHTAVFCEDGKIVEFQIRTEQMHDAAEYGLAAYWRYKETASGISKDQRWVEELATIQREITENSTFLDQLETLKLDVFKDRIFVFTPQGEVIELPEGATPVDFAYAIHTEIGNTCTAARINGEITNLDTPLKSHDMCEIITDQNRKSPDPNWLKFVKTRLAREKIKEMSRRNVAGWIRSVFPDRGPKSKP